MAVPLTIRRLLTVTGVELPVFHPIALKLQHLLEKPDFRMEEVITLANEDPSVASRILRLANSAVNMGRVRTETVRDAVIRLGAHRVANIAMAASQAGLHTSESKIINDLMQKLWLHSHACAAGCRWIAVTAGYPQVAEQAYLAGLLHDVGKLHLLKALERLNERGVALSALDEAILLEIFEELHVEQGLRLMEHWNLPEAYRAVVAQHHGESDQGTDPVTLVVRLANSACRQLGIGVVHEPFLCLSLLPEANLLGLSYNELEALCNVLEESQAVAGVSQDKVFLKRSTAHDRMPPPSMSRATS